jgi:DDE superfamily endonuclease
MEDVLAVYTRPHDPDRPLICVDETSKQLIAETRVPIPMKPGRPARFDYEYERNGTANIFMMFAPLEGWRHVKVTDRHTAVDYAHVLKELADVHFANAKTIALVQDNLNIHSKASLYEAFPAAEARRLVERSGGVRTRHPIVPMPRPPHTRQTNPHRRNCRLGARPQYQPHQGQLALHYAQCTHQTQASIPFNLTESGD